MKILLKRKLYEERKEITEKKGRDNYNLNKQIFVRNEKQQEYLNYLQKLIPEGHPDRKVMERFVDKVDIKGDDECWEWLGGIDKDGYGKFKINGKDIRAHRASWLIHDGEIPSGSFVLHNCDNPSCVNPKCLFLGTSKGNSFDREMKDRENHTSGERYINQTTTWEIVDNLRNDAMNGMTQKELVEKYKIIKQSVSRIINNEQWFNIEYQGWLDDNRDLLRYEGGGESNGRAKYTQEEIDKIRKYFIDEMIKNHGSHFEVREKISKEIREYLSKKYTMSKSTIDRICSNRAWIDSEYQKKLDSLK